MEKYAVGTVINNEGKSYYGDSETVSKAVKSQPNTYNLPFGSWFIKFFKTHSEMIAYVQTELKRLEEEKINRRYICLTEAAV